ncbi:AarF/ABC1/UbiB kinase family protein [Pseudoalteromonas luteoviolacea]|uniref:ABC1 kinase family protein n=1 Tax=Pseudoalteromonas luteoviolacea TaxID=43657 RepID=UPI001F17CFA5|nr:AarF/ABC1/UbiB kinase family protein [Pseudoalteromonas luteoviolacea]MCF6441304.1 AarF/ABC1/UbiB kinase family protein [Pseudoalteromonas luteoviolacea]
MTDKSKRVPSSRISRLAHLGGLASKVASNVVLSGAKQVLSGQSVSKKELLLQPKNVHAVADKLAHLRGAAMKLGQLVSMDAGDLLPKELAVLLEKLRADAQPMPHKQLVQLLKQNWGPDWLDKFSHLELRSFARASIGQVHEATTESGEKLALKIQYPGVANSIDSDVDNVAMLIKMSGLIPKQVVIDPLIEEAKQQLLVETDYFAEGQRLQEFKEGLKNYPAYRVPNFYPQYSTGSILAMEYVVGKELTCYDSASQTQRDKIATDLIRLFFIEMFELGAIQSDPNLANYLYDDKMQQVVLLDFGASRTINMSLAQGYWSLLRAGQTYDKDAMTDAIYEIGYFSDDIDDAYRDIVLELFFMATEPLRAKQPFDFSASDIAARIRDKGMDLSTRERQWHTPPVDALFIHRKLAGLYLIAARLRARVDVSDLFSQFVKPTGQGAQ